MTIYSDVLDVEKLIDTCYNIETGEVDEKQEKELEKLKQSILESGLEKLCKARANRFAMVESLKAEEKRINEKRKSLEKSLDGLEGYIKNVFMLGGKEKETAGTFTVSIRKSEAVCLVDGFESPDFGCYEFKPDKRKIKDALKSGVDVAGASIVVNENIHIK